MRKHISIFILLVMIAFQSYGQTLATKDVFKLKSKRYTFIPDSIVYKDSTDLNPFNLLHNQSQITIFIIGLEQQFRLDIKLTRTDTTACVTAYTYEIRSIKPTSKEKKMFPNYRIDKKEEWKLITKVTEVTDTIINSVLSIIKVVNFDSLPSYETLRDNIGLVQFDGYAFGFNIKQDNVFVTYTVNSLYLNRHEKLKELKPIERLLLDYIASKKEFKVEFLNNACYNSGSAMWICK